MENNVFQNVKDLDLPFGQYALFGSAPMYVHGLRENISDIDIIVTQELWNELSKSEQWQKSISSSGKECLVKDNFELWQNWQPGEWDINKLINEAEVIDGLPFVRLEDVLVWKKLYGREKDLKDVEVIEKFLQT